MFLDEARLAAQLNHPNIVQIYELGQVDDSYFIAMEYVFGRDMGRIIPKAERMGIAFPVVYALKIASSVCEGLHYAHQRADSWGNPLHIVHRDVTPENVFVSFDGDGEDPRLRHRQGARADRRDDASGRSRAS